MYNLDLIQKFVADYNAQPVDAEIAPNDLMHNQWYFEVGRSAVEVILAGIMASYLHRVDRVLDLPCGHGRVLRHLVRMFPNAKFYASDLDTDGVAYCAQRFGAVPVVSKPELTEVDFGEQFELIWVGSLFTHVAQEQCARWLAHLAKFLAPNGIIVATTHGRWCEQVHQRSPYLNDQKWAEVMRGYTGPGGYGYADYAPIEASPSQYLPGNYGVSLAKPHAILRLVENIPGVRIFSYIERAWADHQDVVVFGRPGYDAPWA